MKSLFYKHAIAISIIVLFATIGCFAVKDYGLSWDEPIQRIMGIVSYNFVFEGDKTLSTHIERDHGVGFELPLIIIERALGLTDNHDIFIMRHLVSHFFFLFGAFIFYLLSSKLFSNRTLGIIAMLAFICHPRLYAQSYFNSKDIPFMIAFVLALYALYRAYNKRDVLSYILVGAAVGYATSIRMMSMLFFVIVAGFLIFDILRAKHTGITVKKAITNMVAFLLSSVLFTIAFWPLLWIRPFANFIEAYQDMAKFRWPGQLLFNGNIISGTEIPWNYLPQYMLTTTPILWVIAGILGILTILVLAVRKPFTFIDNAKEKFLLINVLNIVGTLSAIIVLHSVVYDGWRHVFFLYPSLLLLALALLKRVQEAIPKIPITIALSAIQFVTIGIYMFNNHPYQQTYFNRLISHKQDHIRQHFDMDYWGVTCKQGLEYILQHDTSSTIKVNATVDPLWFNREFLPEQDRNRIQLVGCDQGAEYYITFFRVHPKDFNFPETIYTITSQGSPILKVYKMYEPKLHSEKNCKTVWE